MEIHPNNISFLNLVAHLDWYLLGYHIVVIIISQILYAKFLFLTGGSSLFLSCSRICFTITSWATLLLLYVRLASETEIIISRMSSSVSWSNSKCCLSFVWDLYIWKSFWIIPSFWRMENLVPFCQRRKQWLQFLACSLILVGLGHKRNTSL